LTPKIDLHINAWRSSVATAGDVAAPSQIEQSVDVSVGLSQLVRSTSLLGVIDDFCFDSLRRLLATASSC
jgi:hypothetical protein